MLLCNLASLEPGMEVGGSIPHPRRPSTELLRPGVTLDTRMINNYAHLAQNIQFLKRQAKNAVAPPSESS